MTQKAALSHVHVHNLHPSANLHPRANLHPGAIRTPLCRVQVHMLYEPIFYLKFNTRYIRGRFNM